MTQKTVELGAEYDEALRDAVAAAVRRLGGEIVGADWGVAGSQDVTTVTISLDGRALILEAETYVGLSLTGDDDLVDRIVAEASTLR